MKRSMALLLLFLLAGCGTPSGGGMESTDRSGSRASSSAKVHTELAALYYERGQLGIALGEVEQALKADRDYAPAYNVRGLIHMTLREYQEADEDFRHGLSLDSADSEMHNNYGWFLCQRGREKESIPHFMSALKNPLYSTPERAYLNAGLCSRKIGNDSDADEFLQRALLLRVAVELDPRNPDRHLADAVQRATRIRDAAQPGSWERLTADVLAQAAAASLQDRDDLTIAETQRATALSRVTELLAEVDSLNSERDSARRRAAQFEQTAADCDKELQKKTQELERIRRAIRG